ncbi:hypothetical protein K474DRAFT_1686901 [Panus rudis PR-1116 ss-1]|nr:hypothetical protein K474DRAFT_1686901 [Panus rudis PR-1116 ss-1]
MTHTVLSSFDPLATHPFTNNSGLLPKPIPPSQYPHHVPSSTSMTNSSPSTTSQTKRQQQQQQVPLHAPKPSRASGSPAKPTSTSRQRAPIFVPFRPERSSPDLEDILLKKKVADALLNKRQWSIDQAKVPSSSSSSSSSASTPTKRNCYCEENIYLLVQEFAKRAEEDPGKFPWEIYAVFISNDHKTVALWNQKLKEDVVVWDYHVILVLRPRPRPRAQASRPDHACAGTQEPPDLVSPHLRSHDQDLETWIYDFDTRLTTPCTWQTYMMGTFPYAFQSYDEERLKEEFVSSFRVIPSRVYLDHFASDRTHMITGTDEIGNPTYSAPPPSYPPICGRVAKEKGIVNNLFDSFVSMSGSTSMGVAGHVPTSATEMTTDANTNANGADADSEVRSLKAEYFGEVMDMETFIRWLSFGSR